MTWNPPWVRPLVAVDALATYARHLVWPVGLAVDYGRTPAVGCGTTPDRSWASAAATAAVVGGLLWAGRRRHRAVWAGGGGVSVVGLLPVLGLVPFTYQQFSTVADRYAYLPMLGVGLVAARGGVRDAGRRAMPVAAVVLVVLAGRDVGAGRHVAGHDGPVPAGGGGQPRQCPGVQRAGPSRAERAGELPASERYARVAADLDPAEPKYQLAVAPPAVGRAGRRPKRGRSGPGSWVARRPPGAGGRPPTRPSATPASPRGTRSRGRPRRRRRRERGSRAARSRGCRSCRAGVAGAGLVIAGSSRLPRVHDRHASGLEVGACSGSARAARGGWRWRRSSRRPPGPPRPPAAARAVTRPQVAGDLPVDGQDTRPVQLLDPGEPLFEDPSAADRPAGVRCRSPSSPIVITLRKRSSGGTAASRARTAGSERGPLKLRQHAGIDQQPHQPTSRPGEHVAGLKHALQGRARAGSNL